MSDGKIAEMVKKIFSMRPYDIEQRLQLRKPIYSDTASYGHMGRTPEKKEVSFTDGSGKEKKIKIETFTWEKLDKVKEIKKAFHL
jgi:S-adenosylmethionine synthetase